MLVKSAVLAVSHQAGLAASSYLSGSDQSLLLPFQAAVLFRIAL
jgi:hypothetical protein